MNSIFTRKSFYFLLLCFLLSINVKAQTITITTDEWFPYTSKQQDGFLDQLLKEILTHQNVTYTIKYNSFENGYLSTINNKYNATYPYFLTENREKEMLYSEPLFEVKNVLFYNKENFKEDIKGIYNKKIGFVRGYAYNNINIKKFKNPVYIENELVAFDKLNNGEIDLLPGNQLVGTHIIKRFFNDFYSNIDVITHEDYISEDSLYFIMPKSAENEKFLQSFNASLKYLKQSGKYKELLLKNSNLINTNLSSVVTLVNNTETFPMVVATDSLDSKQRYIIPRGTKAIVIQWSKHFKEKGLIKVYDEMFKKTKVKIVNGPLKGRILYVENMYIEIE